MRTIPAEILALIRSDAITDAFAWLLSFGLSTGETLRYARYASAVTYAGDSYEAWPFEGSLQMGGRGHEIPTATLTIADGVRVLRPYALTTNWFRDCTLTSTVVCVSYPGLDYTNLAWTWNIKHAAPRRDDIALTLGPTNIRKMRFPPEQYAAWQCPFALGFKSDPRCGYSGAETTCNGTYSRCEELGNEARYGGWLGLDVGATRLVVALGLRGLF